MTELFTKGTAASNLRLELARAIAQSCPENLATELAVTGSVSRGTARTNSDLEINVWTHLLPHRRQSIPAWLRANLGWLSDLGDISSLYIDRTPIADGSYWVTFRTRGIWIEMSWQRVDVQSSLIKKLRRADVVAHDVLVVADALVHAIPLRSSGMLARWRAELDDYPLVVQDRLIRDASESWMFPLHIDACWEVRGEDRLKFLEHLLCDIHSVLRLVFALNRTWEPNWKRLRQRTALLSVKPQRMASRIDRILSLRDELEARANCYRLILDALKLTPRRFEVARAIDVVTDGLKRHHR